MNREKILQLVRRPGLSLGLLIVSGVGLSRISNAEKKPTTRDEGDDPYTKEQLKEDFNKAVQIISGDLPENIRRMVWRRQLFGERTPKKTLLKPIFNGILEKSRHEIDLRKTS